MKWILIIILAGYIDGGTGVSTAEFNNKSACDNAAARINEYVKGGHTNAYDSRSAVMCLPKGNDSTDEQPK